MALADSELMRQQLLLDGWCVIPSALTATPKELLAGLGTLARLHPTRACHQDLRPYDKNSAPSGSMSATIGTDAQPMHTDGAYYHLPPHYIALQCLEPGEAYCPTHVWALDLARLGRESAAILTRPDWVARGGGFAPFYCPILEKQGGIMRIRFDPLCMHSALIASHALEELQKTLERCSQKVEIEWKWGSFLIVDNWRCLHARGDGAARAPARRLRRWMIGASDGLVA
jgi:alpha-ketoglutarate-dependent taurine dioxygenase